MTEKIRKSCKIIRNRRPLLQERGLFSKAVMDRLNICLLIGVVVTAVYVSQSGTDGAAAAIVLGTTPCTVDANCSSIANTACKSSVCECADLYKEDNKACVLNGINDTCTAAKDCSNANHLTCDKLAAKCDCADTYIPSGGKCVLKDSAVSSKITLGTFCMIMMFSVILKPF